MGKRQLPVIWGGISGAAVLLGNGLRHYYPGRIAIFFIVVGILSFLWSSIELILWVCDYHKNANAKGRKGLYLIILAVLLFVVAIFCTIFGCMEITKGKRLNENAAKATNSLRTQIPFYIGETWIDRADGTPNPIEVDLSKDITLIFHNNVVPKKTLLNCKIDIGLLDSCHVKGAKWDTKSVRSDSKVSWATFKFPSRINLHPAIQQELPPFRIVCQKDIPQIHGQVNLYAQDMDMVEHNLLIVTKRIE